ncbi:Uncharacterized protein FKW44_006985 [Caligus rogercresseyi]|uniref:Uncharacterized protein n=1 Tax=Caligus rogercresseyi TaxID=217165 RepID=A0A7T8KE30_CALRO|nr:Uncharacterized protein FKW44_006985 [Caligus rogercresseyi]
MLYRKLVHIMVQTSRTVVKWSKTCLVPDAPSTASTEDNVDKKLTKERVLETVVPA